MCHHSRISNWKWFSAVVLLFSFFIIGNYSCNKKTVFSNDLAGFNPEGDISIFGITLSGPGVTTGTRFLDVSTGAIYSMDDASLHPEEIDLGMFSSADSGLIFITPANVKSLDNWESGKIMNNTWVVKNKATLFKVSSSEQTAQVFDNIQTAKDVEVAYESTLESAGQGQSQNISQPGESIKSIKSGDLIFFKSEDRNFYAIIYVVNASDGDNGSAKLEIKVDNRNTQEVEPAPAGSQMTLYDATFTDPGLLAGLRAIDLTDGSLYSIPDAENHQEKIDFGLFYSSSTQVTFISPSDSTRLKSWSTGETINSDWLVKNGGEFMRLNASDFTDSLFLYITDNQKIRDAFDIASARVEDEPDYSLRNNGPGPDVGKVNTGDLVFYKSNDKNIYAIAKIGDVNISGNTGTIAATFKVDNSNKVDVAPPPTREITMTVSSTVYTDAHYIDLKTGRVYGQNDALQNSSDIDIIFMKGSSSLNNFLTVNADDASFNAWNKNWLPIIETFPVRNAGTIVDAGSGSQYQDLYNGIHQGVASDFETAYNDLIQNFSTTKRQSKINAGDIIMYHSETRDFYVIINVIESTNDGKLHFKFKLSE